MGKRARPKPKRLTEKLLQIRNALGLSQSEMFRRLDVEELSEFKRISDYEVGKSEPPLPVLLRYARVAGVCLDVLVDDELDLPARLPSKPKHDRKR
jgi:transcriptional regulator with XRE-family HTH domain